LTGESVSDRLPVPARHLAAIATTLERVARRGLLAGNSIEPLINGDEAYPAMIRAIEQAGRSVSLSTYIFDHDAAGLAFAQALGAAVQRGVEVRVLIDATGSRYSWPSILSELRRLNVPHARFLRAFPIHRLPMANLRNHRKILVADGHVAFMGGMNIRAGHWLQRRPSHPVQDIQFRVRGPVVAQLQEIFADDWHFTTAEALRGARWFPELKPEGPVPARAIADGPDDDLDVIELGLLAALASARRSVRIQTPYFLPDAQLIAALNLAALRGVRVEILLPERNNLPFVDWASRAQWWQVLEHGCRIWLAPPPFDHSKITLVDETWVMAGSANWDPRSLRLNFECNVECYDAALAEKLTSLFASKLSRSREVTQRELDERTLPVRLRDGIARLFHPFL
jgi:cardiolipin synthase